MYYIAVYLYILLTYNFAIKLYKFFFFNLQIKWIIWNHSVLSVLLFLPFGTFPPSMRMAALRKNPGFSIGSFKNPDF